MCVTTSTVAMPVSRFDIAEFVGDLFRGTTVSRSLLVTTARSRGARPAVVLALKRLPDRPYRHLSELWKELPEMPDTYDPWADLRADPATSTSNNAQASESD